MNALTKLICVLCVFTFIPGPSGGWAAGPKRASSADERVKPWTVIGLQGKPTIDGAIAAMGDKLPASAKLSLGAGSSLVQMTDKDSVIIFTGAGNFSVYKPEVDASGKISGAFFLPGDGMIIIDCKSDNAQYTVNFWDGEATLSLKKGIVSIDVNHLRANVFCTQGGPASITYNKSTLAVDGNSGYTLYRQSQDYVSYDPTADTRREIMTQVNNAGNDVAAADTPVTPNDVQSADTDPSNPSLVLSGEQLP